LDPDGNFRPLFEKTLKEIFNRFDVDKDKKLSPEELSNFSITCNGKPFDETVLDDIRKFLAVDEKGYLLEEGFLQMYSLQTVTDPNETWKDLKKLGYSKDDFIVVRESDSSDDDGDTSSQTDISIDKSGITVPQRRSRKKSSANSKESGRSSLTSSKKNITNNEDVSTEFSGITISRRSTRSSLSGGSKPSNEDNDKTLISGGITVSQRRSRKKSAANNNEDSISGRLGLTSASVKKDENDDIN